VVDAAAVGIVDGQSCRKRKRRRGVNHSAVTQCNGTVGVLACRLA
jgi:hypothetical protein